MDEPCAALGPEETRMVHDLVRKLKAQPGGSDATANAEAATGDQGDFVLKLHGRILGVLE